MGALEFKEQPSRGSTGSAGLKVIVCDFYTISNNERERERNSLGLMVYSNSLEMLDEIDKIISIHKLIMKHL